MKSLISPNDKFFIAGASGMAGGSIVRALTRAGYGKNAGIKTLLTPSRAEVDLLNPEAVDCWFRKNSPSVVVLAAATVGGIEANHSRPTDFLLNNLKLQNNVIESAWRYGVKRLLFLGSSCITPNLRNNQSAKKPCYQALLSPRMSGTPSPKSLESSSVKRYENNMDLTPSALCQPISTGPAITTIRPEVMSCLHLFVASKKPKKTTNR